MINTILYLFFKKFIIIMDLKKVFFLSKLLIRIRKKTWIVFSFFKF